MEVVGYAASSTDEHGGRRIGRYVDENALLWLVIRCSAGVRFGNARNLKSPRFIVSGLPEIDFMSRLPDDPVRDRFAHLDAGDLPYLVIKAFDVLDVHRGPHFDAGIQQDLNVFPTLRAARARDVGMRQFIDQRDAWPA